MSDIRSCSVCHHSCIAGKDAIVNDKVELVCDSCAGVTRCRRCNTVLTNFGRCSYCMEPVSESGLPWYIGKYYNDL